MSANDAAPDGAASQTDPHNLQSSNDLMDMNEDNTGILQQRSPDKQKRMFRNYMYQDGDSRPYRVVVENVEIENRAVVNRLKVGILLHQNGFDKSIDDIRKTGRNKVTVYVGNLRDANRLAACKNLELKGYKSYIPKQFVTTTGVISGIPLDMTEEEIREAIKCRLEVDSVFRMHRFRDNQKEATYRMGVVFRSNSLPQYVSIFSAIHRVQPFIRKPVICYRCLRYNHLSKQCKATIEKCPSCAKEHPTDKSCKVIKCLYCESSDHRTTDKVCPKWKTESEIQTIMAKKCVTYQEAKQLFECPTENQFDVLRTAEEYPTPAELYSRVAAKHPVRPLQQERTEKQKHTQRNNQRRKKNQDEEEGSEIVPGVASLLGMTPREFAKKRKIQEEEEETRGTGLKNQYNSSELERFKKEIEASIKKQTRKEWSNIMTELNTKVEAILKPHGIAGEELSASIMSELRSVIGQTGVS